MPPKRSDVGARFWAKVAKSDGCWLWTGCIHPSGYGWFTADNSRGPELAHRVAFRLTHGRDAVEACHTCDVRACVNPDHVYDGTRATNMQDALRRGRHAQAAKTHCPQGHPYDEANTLRWTDGKKRQRGCRTCSRRYKREYAARQLARLRGTPDAETPQE